MKKNGKKSDNTEKMLEIARKKMISAKNGRDYHTYRQEYEALEQEIYLEQRPQSGNFWLYVIAIAAVSVLIGWRMA